MIFLAFFEMPDWCVNDPDLYDTVYCTPPQGGISPRGKPPTSGFPFLPPYVSYSMEILILIFINFFTVLKLRQKRVSKKEQYLIYC